MTGRAPSGQALAVPATPLRVDGPSGFDPSRLADVIENTEGIARLIDLYKEAVVMLLREAAK